MDTKTLVTIILPSAAVGALVSAFIQFIGQVFERRARREELLLTKAIELAEQRLQLSKDLALAQKRKTAFPQAIVMAADYYQYLRVLIKTGALPADYLERYSANEKALLGKSSGPASTEEE